MTSRSYPPFFSAGLTQILSQVHVLSAHLSLITGNYGERVCPTWELSTLDWTATAITGMENINGYLRLGLLTSE